MMRICILHRHPPDKIQATNAAFPYLLEELRPHRVDIKTYRRFDRFKFIKSLWWIFYAPLLVVGRKYDVIYCDDSFPFYAGLVKMVTKAKVVKRMGDFHLMYYFGGVFYKLLNWIERFEWRAVDLLLPVSQPMADFIGDNCKVILDPVDFDKFNTDDAYDRNVPICDVMFHGTLGKNKGLKMLEEVARRLPNVTFVVIGKPRRNTRLRNLTYLGWKPFQEIPGYLAKTKTGLALRTFNRGNEYVYTQPFLQYSAMGVPVLATKRKVLGDYPWQFSTIDEMEIKIRYMLSHSVEPADVSQHDARKVARELAEAIR